LYPRAKFADALAIIEKLGHTKRMQTMRKEWIRESKPQDTLDASENFTKKADYAEKSSRLAQDQSPAVAPLERPRTPVDANGIDDEDDEIYAATPRPGKEGSKVKHDASKESLFISDDEEALGEQPQEDDLDALLAEDETKKAEGAALPTEQDQSRQQMEDNFEDDMEAMAGLDDW
jgi:replication fork protection complex subunit Csm3/Swi3